MECVYDVGKIYWDTVCLRAVELSRMRNCAFISFAE